MDEVATPEPGDRRRRPPLLLVAASIIAVVAAVTLASRDGDERPVRVTNPADTSTTSQTPTTTAPSVTPAPSQDGSEEAVLAFLDELGSGKIDAAAGRLGPLSENYLKTTAGSVKRFLLEAQEGYGAWAAVEDREVGAIEMRPGDVVVVVSGRVHLEGTVEDRTDAFPVRYSPSSGVWFVELWARDPQTRAGVAWADGGTAGATVSFSVPAAGTVWISDTHGNDPGVPTERSVGRGRTETLDLSCCPGDHLVVVAHVGDGTFSAIAKRVEV